MSELNALLNMDQKESDTLALEVDETEDSALNHTASKNDAKEADLAIIPAEYSHKTINEQIQNIAQKKDTLCRRMYN